MGSSPVQNAAKSIIEWGLKNEKSAAARPKATEIFGSLTFGDDTQRRRLPRDAYKALRRTVTHGEPLDAADRKSTRLNSSHVSESRMPSSA